MIVGGEDRHDDADALHDEAEIVAQQLRKRAHLAVEAHLLELAAAVKLKRMLEHARHFPSRGRHARDRHERVLVDLEHFVRAIIDHEVAGRRAPIARDEHAIGKFEGEDRRRVRRRDGGRWRRRRRAGGLRIKPLLAQQRAKSSGAGGKPAARVGVSSITRRCAGGSVWIDSDRPGACAGADPSCRAWRRRALWARRHRLVAGPTERDRLVVASFQACRSLRD